MSEQCPCGSGLAYEQCCRPYLEGKTWPETAEALVRSRYTAYGSGHFDYLVETTHPDYRDGITAERLAQSAEGVRWHRLDIAATAENVPAGENGERYDTVDFHAFYELDGVLRQIGEKSFFARGDGRLYYVDGVPLRGETYCRPSPKVGRNDPCPCGSGKKFKKCCGVPA